MKISSAIPGTFGRMKKNAFLLIVLINSFALLGLFVTQVFWIREAHGLLDEQFSGSVRIALRGVVNQMHDYEIKHAEKSEKLSRGKLLNYRPDISNMSLSLLEFKINEEFNCMQVGSDYEFAIIDKRDQSLKMGKYKQYSKELISSPNQVSLVGFKESEHYYLSAWFPEQHKHILKQLLNWIIISLFLALILIIGFPVSLYIFNRQKRLSGMKSDFINNMTHEFKTPIATISLASEMLLKKPVQQDHEKTIRYARIIFDENTRLQNHVEQILSVSRLERGQFRLRKKTIDIHQLIGEIVNNFSLSLKEKEGSINTHYGAGQFIIYADKDHLTNVIFNLLDNASKYSPQKPSIRIGTQSTAYGLTISVEDKGIGISLENQRQIFKNFYRVSTGNIYSVKGFGIGLYYVKTIVEAHGGHINIKSELDKGSRFDVYLPFVNKSSQDDEYNQTENPSR